MLSTRLAVKLLYASLLALLLSVALLQWRKYSYQGTDFEIRAIVLLVMFFMIGVYCFAMVLLLSYFASMGFPFYLKNMGEDRGRKLLFIWRLVLTKEKYLELEKLTFEFK